MSENDIDVFFNWFEKHGGYIDRESINITPQFSASEGTRGAVALKDILVRNQHSINIHSLTNRLESKEGHTLFSIPRTLLLGVQTCNLRSLFGLEQWHSAKLDKGWSGIILSLMWEAAQGSQSKWATYFGKRTF